MSDTHTETPAAGGQAPQGSEVVVARAGRYYRNARYAMVLICVALGGWFIYDGWMTYPAENAAARAKGHPLPHSEELDIPLQRGLGIALPLLGLGMLVYFLYRSRGEYRLDGNTLHVPGHPPIPLDSIRTIDKTKWDRKGIAHLEYEVPGSTETRRVTLDDFVYDQTPTDTILERIEAVLVPPGEGDDATASGSESADDGGADAAAKERAEA